MERDGEEIRGKISLIPYKRYVSFEVAEKKETDSCGEKEAEKEHMLSDYDLGCAYKYGRYKLKENQVKAQEYLKKAAVSGDADAFRELADSYEKGLGCIPNARRARAYREKADELERK